MLAYFNGQYLSEDQPAISVSDRSFRYGDGLFETVRISNGQPFLWSKHMARLRRGAEFLKIAMLDEKAAEEAVRHLLSQNDCPEGFARIHLSRGANTRGYSVKDSGTPTLAITTHNVLHTSSHGLKLKTSTVRVLANDPLSQYKTANRLPSVLAKTEAERAGVDDALILNHLGNVAEASGANIFCVFNREVVTPPLSDGALAGTTREFILEISNGREWSFKPEDILRADAVFLTSASLLTAPVIELDGQILSSSGRDLVNDLRKRCEEER